MKKTNDDATKRSPAERLTHVQELLAAGYFGDPDSEAARAKAVEALGFPDVEAK